MFRAFFQPLRHLALDDARVDAIASGLDLFLAHLPQKAFVPLVEGLCVRGHTFGQATLQDAETADEGQTIHIQIVRPSHLMARSVSLRLPPSLLTRAGALRLI